MEQEQNRVKNKSPWNKCPMPLKKITMLWDGEMLFGPVAPQDEDTRSQIVKRLKPTHWMELPPAPSR